MSQNVSVAVRLRPLSGKEKLDGCSNCLQMTNEKSLFCPPDKIFTFDKIFDATATQSQVFNESVVQILETFLQGYNATVLAYGQVILFIIKDWLR